MLNAYESAYPGHSRWTDVIPAPVEAEAGGRYPKRTRVPRVMYWCEKVTYQDNHLTGIHTKMPDRWKDTNLKEKIALLKYSNCRLVSAGATIVLELSLLPFLPVGCPALEEAILLTNVDCPLLVVSHQRGETRAHPGDSLRFAKGEPLQLDSKTAQGIVILEFERTKL
jgi:hypothetical protein